jgi:hypothetical protein
MVLFAIVLSCQQCYDLAKSMKVLFQEGILRMTRYVPVLLLSLFVVPCAQADWLNYSVAVSSSPNGPFGATVNLWTQGALSVDLTGESGPPNVFNGNAYLPLGFLTANFGNSTTPNFPQMPFAFQIQGNKSLILSGNLNISNYWNVTFNSVTATDHGIAVALEAMQPPMPASGVPGWTPSSIGHFDIIAVIPANDLVQTPEPTGVLLAGIGALFFMAVRYRCPARRAPAP